MAPMWNAEAEMMPRDRLAELQLERLRTTVDRLLTHVPPIAQRLHAVGVQSGADIGDVGVIRNLPFTHKVDLREHYPFGLLAVPRRSEEHTSELQSRLHLVC